MAGYNTSDFKKGIKVMVDGDPYLMIECNLSSRAKVRHCTNQAAQPSAWQRAGNERTSRAIALMPPMSVMMNSSSFTSTARTLSSWIPTPSNSQS